MYKHLAQPPAPPPLVPLLQGSKCSIHQMDPILFFQRSCGWSRLTEPAARSFQGAPRRLKPVDGLSSGSHVRKTKTPFFACSWHASLNPCDGFPHRCHTNIRTWQTKTTMSITPDRCPFTEPCDCFRSANRLDSQTIPSSGSHSTSLELSLGRSFPSLGKRWYTPTSGTQNRQGTSLRSNSHRPQTSVRFRAQGSIHWKASNCSFFPSQQSKNGSSWRSSLQSFRNFPQNVSVLLSHELGGSGGVISVVSFVNSSSTPMAHFVRSLFLRFRNFHRGEFWLCNLL